MPNTITLQFQTPQDLTGFRSTLKIKEFSVDIKNLVLICECNDEAVALAMNNFGAVVKSETKK